MTQAVSEAQCFKTRAVLTKRRIQVTKRHIRRIETAKALVCGVPSEEAISKLRRDFEDLLPLLEERHRLLNSGELDNFGDLQLREVLVALQEIDAKMSFIYDGSRRIGLEAIEPFPQILAKFKAHQERLQSQIEGIMLSLSDSFQDLVVKSSREIAVDK